MMGLTDKGDEGESEDENEKPKENGYGTSTQSITLEEIANGADEVERK